jgi:hypothetical protein
VRKLAVLVQVAVIRVRGRQPRSAHCPAGGPASTRPKDKLRYWSRPIRARAGSALARMSRYSPSSPGIPAPQTQPPPVLNGTSRQYLAQFKKVNRIQELTLNQRVRGSSPSWRTRSDLGLCRFQVIFLCPICPFAGSVLARVFFGRSCVAVKTGAVWETTQIRALSGTLRTVRSAGCGPRKMLAPPRVSRAARFSAWFQPT